MAGSYNKLTIIGNLGRDPQMRYLPDGTPLTAFDVAVNERRQADGQRVQATQWFHVTCYGKLAETAAQHLCQGRSVLVEGPLAVREYGGQAGQKRLALDIRARDLRLLEGLRQETGAASAASGMASAPSTDQEAEATQATSTVLDDLDLDAVPF